MKEKIKRLSIEINLNIKKILIACIAVFLCVFVEWCGWGKNVKNS